MVAKEGKKMPIKGLSDVRRLPRAGKIHLGVKDEGGGFPRVVDYFVCKADDSTQAEMADRFKRVYGEQPKSLQIVFPVDDPETIFPQYLKLYGKGTGLKRRCDGDNCLIWDDQAQDMIEKPCACKHEIEVGVKDSKGRPMTEPQCKEMGNLIFLLPDVYPYGTWQIDTGSSMSIVRLNSVLEVVRRANGTVAGIPMTLTLVPVEVSPDGKKKTVYVLDIRANWVPGDARPALEAPKTTAALPPAPEPIPPARAVLSQPVSAVDRPAPKNVLDQVKSMYTKTFPQGNLITSLGSIAGVERLEELTLKQANEFINWIIREGKATHGK